MTTTKRSNGQFRVCSKLPSLRRSALGLGLLGILAAAIFGMPVSPAHAADPVFTQSSYFFEVFENAGVGTTVGTVAATDADAGDTLTYSITAGNTGSKFAIDGSSGVITTAGELDYESTSSYELTLQVSDGTNTDTAPLSITVIDLSATVDVCDRTPEVRKAIVFAAFKAPDECALIEDTDLREITELEVEGYSGSVLLVSDFDNLTGLTELSVRTSPTLTTVPDGAFTGAPALTRLDLRNNAIRTIHGGAFRGLPALESLDLSLNQIRELPASFQGEFTVLESLRLSSNYLGDMPSGQFSGLSGLRTLDLSYNRLSGLSAGAFDDAAALTKLYLGGNRLADSSGMVPKDTFDAFTGLETLTLDDMGIEALHVDTFESLAKLEALSLSDNELTGLPADVFDDVSNLDALDLAHNKIASLHVDVFDGLALYILDLEGNELTTLPSDIFDTHGLSILNLSYNKLTSVPHDLFFWQTAYYDATLDLDVDSSLDTLFLHENEITTLHEHTFRGLNQLSEVTLNGNRLTTLPAAVFAEMRCERLMDLSDNRISTLPATVFDGMGRLQHLDLSNNELSASSLPANLFQFLGGMEEFSLDGNQFATLPTNVFAGMAKVEKLDLSDNGLTTLDLNQFDPFAGVLTYLDISGNSFTPTPADAALRAKLTAIETLYVEKGPHSGAISSISIEGGSVEEVFVPGHFVVNPRGMRATAPAGAVALTIKVEFEDEDALPATLSRPYGKTGPFHVSSLFYDFHDRDTGEAGIQIGPPLSRLSRVRFDAGEKFYIINVHREAEPEEAPSGCDPGPVSLDTYLSDLNGMPGVYKFDGPKRELIVLAWDAPDRRECVARTELWRKDGRDGGGYQVKAWNGSPWGPRGIEGAWRDSESRLHSAYQYTVRRYGSDGTVHEAKTQWIPVLPFYLDTAASWKDIRTGSITAVNNSPHYMKIEMGGNGGEVGGGSTSALSDVEAGEVNGLYTYESCVWQYASMTCSARRDADSEDGIFGDRVSVNWVSFSIGGHSTGHYTPDRGHLNRNSVLCFRVIYLNPATFAERLFYNSCNVYDGIWARHITNTSQPSGAPPDAPSAPQNLAATAGADGIALSWDATAGATGYRVLRRLQDLATYTEIGVSATNSYTDTTAEVAVGYAYQVKAVNDTGSSDASEHVLAMIIPPAPDAPTGFEAGIGEDSVILSWDTPDDNTITQYIVTRDVRDADPPQTVLLRRKPGETHQVTDSSPEEGAAYTYSVMAINAGGRSDAATVDVDFPEANDDLEAPTGLAATVSGGTVVLAWDAVDDATGYHVMRQGPGETEHTQLAAPTTNAYTDTAVTGGSSYSYQVRAVDDDGVGSLTGAVTADVPAAPDAPANVQAAATGGSVTLTWTAPGETLSGYFVYRKVRNADPPEDFAFHNVAAADATSYTDTTVEAETAYAYYVVAARSALELSAPSATVEVDTPAASPFTGFTLVDASDQSVLASLTDGASVELSDASGGSYGVRANLAVGETVGSVKLELTGAKSVARTENTAPYSLYGDSYQGDESDLHGQSLPAGSYTLTATAYSESAAGGDELGTLEVSFTVTQANRAPAFGSATYSFSIAEDASTGAAVGSVSATDADGDGITYSIESGNGDGEFAIDGSTGAITTAGALDHGTTPSYTLTVQADDGEGGTDTATVNVTVTEVDESTAGPLTGFTLVDASNQSVLATLTAGTSVALADPDGGSYAIRADVDSTASIGSVRLVLSGAKSVTKTESYAPYSLYGDSYEGAASDLHGQALPSGSYTLRATAYSERAGGGDELGTLEVSFTITAGN